MQKENSVMSDEQRELLCEAARYGDLMKTLCSFKQYVELLGWFCDEEGNAKKSWGEVESKRVSDVFFLLDYALNVVLSYQGAVRGALQEGGNALALLDVPMDRETIAREIKHLVTFPLICDHRVAADVSRAIGIEVMDVEALAQEDTYLYLETVVRRIARENDWSAWSDCLLALVMLPSEEKRQQSASLFLSSVRRALMQEDRLRRLDLLKVVMRYCDL